MMNMRMKDGYAIQVIVHGVPIAQVRELLAIFSDADYDIPADSGEDGAHQIGWTLNVRTDAEHHDYGRAAHATRLRQLADLIER